MMWDYGSRTLWQFGRGLLWAEGESHKRYVVHTR